MLLTRTKQQASSSQAKITNGDVESFLELRRIIQSIESILASPKRADQEEEKN